MHVQYRGEINARFDLKNVHGGGVVLKAYLNDIAGAG